MNTNEAPISLNPCPLCKGKADIALDMGMYYCNHFVKCLNCGAHGPVKVHKNDAIEAWNTRAYEQIRFFIHDEDKVFATTGEWDFGIYIHDDGRVEESMGGMKSEDFIRENNLTEITKDQAEKIAKRSLDGPFVTINSLFLQDERSKRRDLEMKCAILQKSNDTMRDEFEHLACICTCNRPTKINPDGSVTAPGPHTDKCVRSIAKKILSIYEK